MDEDFLKFLLKFFGFFGLNLLAAYAPSLLWVPWFPGSSGKAWVFLVSPVGCSIIDATSFTVVWCYLGGFLTIVGILSALTFRSKDTWVIVPSLIAVYSLLQGVMTA